MKKNMMYKEVLGDLLRIDSTIYQLIKSPPISLPQSTLFYIDDFM